MKTNALTDQEFRQGVFEKLDTIIALLKKEAPPTVASGRVKKPKLTRRQRDKEYDQWALKLLVKSFGESFLNYVKH